MSKPITVNKLLSPSRVFPANTGTHVGRFFVANVMEVTTSADIGGLFYLQKSTGGSRVFGLGVSSEDDYKQDLVLCDRTVELSEEEMRGELRPLEDVNKVHVFTPDGPFAIIHDEHAINLLPSFEEDDIDCTIREDNRVLLAHRNRWIDVNIYTTSDSIDLHQSLGDKQMSDPLFWIVDSEDGNGDPESTSITRVFSVHYCGKDFNDQTEDVNDGKVAIHEEEAKAESSGKSSRSSKKSKKRKARSAASAKRVKKGRIGGDAKEPAEVIDARKHLSRSLFDLTRVFRMKTRYVVPLEIATHWDYIVKHIETEIAAISSVVSDYEATRSAKLHGESHKACD